MRSADFIEDVRSRVGVDEGTAKAIVSKTLETIGELLPPDRRGALGQMFPDELRKWLLSRRAGQKFDADELYRRVAVREGTTFGFGLEHAQCVCQLLGRRLDPGDVESLKEALPTDVARLF